MRLTFDEWMPDQAALGRATVIRNVVPFAEDYGPLRDLLSFTNALDNVCLGSTWARTGDSTVWNFAGDDTKLYRLNTDTWTNVSKSGNYTNVTNWEFERFGDRIIAVALNTPTQAYDMGTSSLFADLSGAPSAARVGIVRNFVVLGDVDDGTDYPSRVQWSGYNNSELWTPSRATQADFRDLRGSGGRVQKVVSGQTGFIFQENSIWAMSYAGPPVIFSMDEVERGRGTPSPNSVVRVGQRIFYLGQDGFYSFAGSSDPIGAERVNRWFFQNCGELESVRSGIDYRNHLVLWAFRTSDSLAYNDRLLIFNWSTNRWSYGEVDTEVLSNMASSGLHLDNLDTVLTSGIDTSSIPVDSPIYQGGEVALAAFDSSHKSATFSGDYLTATLDTRELGEASGTKARIRSVRPLVTGASAMTAQIGTRDRMEDNAEYSLETGQNKVGEFNFRKKARFNRVRLNISGGFEHAKGVDLTEVREGGRR